jgi:hypothetical protein
LSKTAAFSTHGDALKKPVLADLSCTTVAGMKNPAALPQRGLSLSIFN